MSAASKIEAALRRQGWVPAPGDRSRIRAALAAYEVADRRYAAARPPSPLPPWEDRRGHMPSVEAELARRGVSLAPEGHAPGNFSLGAWWAA